MRFLTTFFLGMVVGGGGVFFAQKVHVLRTEQGVEFVPKLTTGFSETYVDVRQFSAGDWENHKELAAAIVHAKKEYILSGSASEQTRQGIGSFVDQLKSLKSG